MIYKKYVIVAIAVLFKSLIGMAQELKNTHVISPSPTAASLGRYGDTPISLYTGTPNISIPLWEMKEGSITVPVSLNYNSSGLKVDEIASWVGLGWSLNAGGVITRSIRGNDDFGNISGGVGYRNLGTTFPFGGDIFTDCKNPNTGFNYNGFVSSVLDGKEDSEPDVYYFNFLGYTGKFVFDNYGNVHLLTQKNIQIIPPTSQSSQGEWKIRTPDGMIFLFGGTGFIETTSVSTTPGSSVLSWYLKSITSPAGEFVSFSYEPYVSQIESRTSYISIVNNNTFEQFINADGTSTYFCKYPETGNSYQPNLLTTINGLHLKSIQTSSSIAYFDVSSLSRCDAAGQKRLDTIRIMCSGVIDPIRKFTFKYSYDSSNPESPRPLNCNDVQASNGRRLWLHNITEIGEDDSTLPPYAFTYFPGELPPRLTGDVDAWGYNKSIIFVPVFNAFSCNPEFDVKPTQCSDCPKYGVLTKIDYPTGGATSFEYENHESPDAEYNSYTDYYPLRACVKACNCAPAYQSSSCGSVMNRTSFTVTSETLGTVKNFNFPVGVDPQLVYVELRHAPLYDYGPKILKKKYEPIPVVNGQQGTYQPIVLEPGNWEIVVYVDSYYQASLINGVKVFFELQYTRLEPTTPYRTMIGGIRLRRKIDFDGLNVTNSIINDYSYVVPNTSISSGVLMNKPVYQYNTNLVDCQLIRTSLSLPSTYDCRTCSYTYKNPFESFVPLGSSAQGSHIGYTFVSVTSKESIASANQSLNGRSIYKYFNQAEIPLTQLSSTGGSSYPHPVPSLDFSMMNGLLIQEQEENADGEIVRLASNYYSVNNPVHIYGYKLAGNTNMILNGGMVNPCGYIQQTKYKIVSGWVKLDSMAVSEYTGTGSTRPSLTILTRYAYSNSFHKNATRIERESSKNEKVITKILYPQDLSANAFVNSTDTKAQAIYYLNKMFMHNQIIETQEIRKVGSQEYLVSGLLNTFKYQSGSGSVVERVVPAQIFQMEVAPMYAGFIQARIDYPGGPLVYDPLYKSKAQFSYKTINGFNNLIDFSESNGTKVAYLWGYDMLLPVAKAINAKSSDIYFNGFEDADGNSSLHDANTGERSRTNGYSKNLTGIQNGAYILSYMKKENELWILHAQSITVSGSTYSINLSGQLDDIRFCPTNAEMTTFTYTKQRKLSSSTDLNYITTYYEYDAFGRLIFIKNGKREIVSKYDYQYKH
jgi:hypothetical protein